jgi:thermitase
MRFATRVRVGVGAALLAAAGIGCGDAVSGGSDMHPRPAVTPIDEPSAPVRPGGASAGEPSPLEAEDGGTRPDATAGDARAFDPVEAERATVAENWAFRATRAIEAWKLVRDRGREPGEGILIAHPDTGISRHPELLAHGGRPSPIAWELGRDFVDGDKQPFHEFDALNRVPPHGHGTETSSVIVSPIGCPPDFTPRPCVTGVAPAARLVPMRVSDAVILLAGDRLAAAIDYAVSIDAHVVSISLGGVTPMQPLREAVARALDAGLIVVAAGGNFTGTVVVSPSTYDGVVSVGGVTPELKPWDASARGGRIDISGPATEVTFARTVPDAKGLFEYTTGRAQGTSDATAITAGAAAIWLTYHGRDALLARYGAAGIPKVFRHLVKTVAFRTPPGWPASGFGPGILDIAKLLEAPLPSDVPSPT